jgi:phosphate transport system permease protein
MNRYRWRRLRNTIVIALSISATMLGLGWLVLILGSLVYKGLSGLSPTVFTQMTPPPGSDGGLLNPIIGSLMLTVLAVVFGTPIGILAGTYMAEYGKFTKLTLVVRFINDILLSAPSIVVGLFVYEILVAPFGGFSGWAGAVAKGTARVCGSSWIAARLRDPPRLLPGGARRHHHRYAARHRPDQR